MSIFGRIVDLRNNTVGDILIEDLGVSVPGNASAVTTNVLRVSDFISADTLDFSQDLRGFLDAGDISINGKNGNGDGTAASNLSIAESLDEISITTIDPATVDQFEGTCLSGLNFDISGGIINIAGGIFTPASASFVLTDDTINYIYITTSGVITVNTTGFPTESAPLYKLTTAAGEITSCLDQRSYLDNNIEGATGLQGPTGLLGSTGLQGAQGATGIGAGDQGATGVQGTTGPSGGPAGVTGVQGIQGTTGIQGVTGIQGIQGLRGFTGIQGAQGTTGVQGVQGVTGAGVQGATGTQGIQGDTGVLGATGVAGPEGTQGDTGLQGVQGVQGIQGVQGNTGTQGNQGTTGLQGVQGIQGGQGTQGDTGVQGIQGSTGAGPQGTTGVGTTGPSGGPPGVTGPQGPTGPSGGPIGATGVQGVTGAGVQGTTGIQGSQGAQGVTGVQGVQGIQGTQGPLGNTGIRGATGLTGQQGTTGAQGQTGVQGTTGLHGVTGVQGIQGDQGDTGVQGVTGLSITGVTGPLGTSQLAVIQVKRTTDFTVPLGFGDVEMDVTCIENNPDCLEHDDVNTDRLLVKADGVYLIMYNILVDTDDSGTVEGRVRKNDTTVLDCSSRTIVEGGSVSNPGLGDSDSGDDLAQADSCLIEGSFIAELSNGDFITLQVGKAGGTHTAKPEICFSAIKLNSVAGPTGPAGAPQGVTGLQGITGLQGVTGLLGNTGITGQQGPQGIQGNTGLQGPQGIQGGTGSQGTTGAGIQGATGLQGPQGSQGATGAGITGPAGIGATGVQGATGAGGGGSSLFGSEYTYAESLGQSSTTNTSFVNKVTLTTTSLPAGDYHIGWSCEICKTDYCTDDCTDFIEVQIELDDTTQLALFNSKQKDEDGFEAGSGFKKVTLTAATHTVDMDFRTENNAGSVKIRRASIELWRVN